jgi:hypothetical protein
MLITKLFKVLLPFLLAGALSHARADSWNFEPTVVNREYSFGQTKVVLSSDARLNQKLPDYLLVVYESGAEVARYPGIAFDALFASPTNDLFVGLSNSGIPGTAVVVFDKTGSIRLLASHGLAEFDYCEKSVTLKRVWYDGKQTALDFELDQTDPGIYLRNCRGQRVELLRTVMAAHAEVLRKMDVKNEAVVVGSFFTSSPDYWNVAPWLIVASNPACLIVFIIIAVFSTPLQGSVT